MIVNWNSLHLLQPTLAAVQRHTPKKILRVIVVDNASTDGSQEWLRTQQVKAVRLDRNMGHGHAMDIGFLAARTRIVVALDVDAFPIADDWLERPVVALLRKGATVSGAHGGRVLDQHTPGVPDDYHRDFIHPCFLAMRLRRFVWRRHTFRSQHGTDRRLDIGEAISETERRNGGALHPIDPTSIRGPGALGTVFGDVVYHNFYGVRHEHEDTDIIEGITAGESRQAWQEAVAKYVG